MGSRGWFTLPAGWLASTGVIAKFCVRVLRDVWGGRVLRFFGETLRQAGILILSSTIVIWGLVFIIGLQCGIEGAYFTRSQGTPAYAGIADASIVSLPGLLNFVPLTDAAGWSLL